MIDNWRPVTGYESQYEINASTKQVRSLHPRNYHKILAQYQDENGIRYVQLYRDGVMKNAKLHRILAEAFLPNFWKKKYVVFKDGNPENLELDNLTWIDRSEMCRLSKSKQFLEEIILFIKGSDESVDDLVHDLNRDFKIEKILA
jgi:hypothetical protein